jgi:hypothetical protein
MTELYYLVLHSPPPILCIVYFTGLEYDFFLRYFNNVWGVSVLRYRGVLPHAPDIDGYI